MSATPSKFRQNPRGWLFGLPAVIALAACQTPQREGMPPLRIAPTTRVEHSVDAATAAYTLGRYYQGQRRDEDAIAAYRHALALDPKHAEARNRLGMALAARGQLDLALREFAEAVALAPATARFRNNLGYAQLQRGDAGMAAKTLSSAREIDPANPRIRANLQLALERSGQPEGTGPAASAAVALDTAASARPANPQPAAMRPAATGVSAAERESPGSGNPPATPVRAAPARLEIANGNGVTGMAKRVSAVFGDAGYAPARLTNRKPFDFPRTEIHYRPGHESDALALNRHLPHPAPLVPSAGLRRDIPLRLVLGHDLRRLPAGAPPGLRTESPPPGKSPET